MVKERGRTELLLEVSRTALKTTACWIDASVFHWMKMDANMMQKKDGKLLNEDQLEVKSWYLQIWEVSLLTLSLFEAQLCIQNQFIIWGSVSPRQKEIRNDRRRVWTFPQLLTGIFQPNPYPANICLYGWCRPEHGHNSTCLTAFLQLSGTVLISDTILDANRDG